MTSELGTPGKHTLQRTEKQIKRRKAVRTKQAIPSTKGRQLILKSERALFTLASEALDGTSYQSGKQYAVFFVIFRMSGPVFFFYSTGPHDQSLKTLKVNPCIAIPIY